MNLDEAKQKQQRRQAFLDAFETFRESLAELDMQAACVCAVSQMEGEHDERMHAHFFLIGPDPVDRSNMGYRMMSGPHNIRYNLAHCLERQAQALRRHEYSWTPDKVFPEEE